MKAPRPDIEHRTYYYSKSVVFRKTKEAFGGLSNMASGYPLRVEGMRIPSSEALYQACRFPHFPDVQQQIISEASPMTAKMRSKPFRNQSRQDWDYVRVKIMRWVLRVKLAQNFEKFSELLLSTGDKPIVEDSHKDDFWGAKSIDSQTLAGTNVLGRLLMELREELKSSKFTEQTEVLPLQINNFLLCNKPIGIIGGSKSNNNYLLSIPQITETPKQLLLIGDEQHDTKSFETDTISPIATDTTPAHQQQPQEVDSNPGPGYQETVLKQSIPEEENTSPKLISDQPLKGKVVKRNFIFRIWAWFSNFRVN